MIDAGYLEYPRLTEKLKRINVEPEQIHEIFLTHADSEHVGAIDKESEKLFSEANVFMSDVENKYVTGEATRKFLHFIPVRRPKISNPITLLHNEETIMIGDIKVQGILVPGHTAGHMVYVIDDQYLFTGDSIALGSDGGYNFIWFLSMNYKQNIESVKRLKTLLKDKTIKKAYTAHTGTTTDMDFLFRNIEKNRRLFLKKALIS